MLPDDVPRLARPFVAAVVALMIASALFLWEPWPVTSFRLFSHLRFDEQSAWRATLVEPDGAEEPYPLDAMPNGFRGFNFVMAEFVDADAARRDELCRTWVGAAPDLVGEEAEEVRLYLRTWKLSERRGDRALPGIDEHRFTCSSTGVTVVDG
jgi:hypothetical protein